jgi:hypothetical protein
VVEWRDGLGGDAQGHQPVILVEGILRVRKREDGWGSELMECLGRSWVLFIVPDRREEASHGVNCHQQVRFDGSWWWVALKAVPVIGS